MDSTAAFHSSARVIRDEAGNRIAFHGVMLDTTPLSGGDGATAVGQEMHRVMDTVPTIIWSMSPDAVLLFMNKVARELTGASLEDIQKGKWVEYTHPRIAS
jgi:PAS domain-containing protein